MKRSIRDKFEKLSSFSDEELRELRDYILIEANELKHKPIEKDSTRVYEAFEDVGFFGLLKNLGLTEIEAIKEMRQCKQDIQHLCDTALGNYEIKRNRNNEPVIRRYGYIYDPKINPEYIAMCDELIGVFRKYFKKETK